MITIFQQIAQTITLNSQAIAKLDALTTKVDTLAADVAAIKTAQASATQPADLTALTQMVSDIQATVINTYTVIGNGGS